MENRFDIRYKSSLIWIFIFAMSILATLASMFFSRNADNSLLKVDQRYEYRNAIYSRIYESLYDNDREYIDQYSGTEEKGIDFYIRSFKIANYPFTEEYKKIYKNNYVARDVDGEFRYIDFDQMKEILNGVEPSAFGYTEDQIKNSSYYKTEEPEYKTTHLSNKNVMENQDPQDLAIDDKNGEILYVKGFYEDGKLRFTDTNIENNKLDSKDVNNFVAALKAVYSNIDSSQNGIKKINFAYTFNPNSGFYNEIKSSINFRYTVYAQILIGVIGSLILMGIFALISNYEKTKSLSFYKGLAKFPVEFVFFCSCFWITGLAFIAVAYSEFNFSGNFGMDLDTYAKLSYIGEFIAIITGSLAVFYIIYSIKDLYNQGFRSSLVSNSIVARVIRFISRIFKKILIKSNDHIYNLANENYSKYALFVYIGFIGLGFIACSTIVKYGMGFIVFILWTVLVSFIYKKLSKYIGSVAEIDEVSKLISDGDYSVKIGDENEFRSIKENINAISDNLNSAIDKAIKSERLKTELVTNVSHDLKTPLTSIINYSELIRDDKLKKEEVDKYANIIHDKSLKLKSLIEDLFEISKVASNNVELHKENIDFRSLLNQVVGEWEDKLQEKNLDMQVKYPDKPVILNLDGDKTSRVIDNLMSNIYKYALENTRIYIDLIQDKEVKLIIKNISKYPLNISASELIERFTRGDSSRNTPGSGLGLSIASSLVNAQAGKFNIDIDGDLFKTTISF